MLKKETFNIEDSNVAGLGSDLDKKCRLDAAATEKAWAKAGKEPGMQIWRIEQFKVVPSKTPAGTFYTDDSYICLNTRKCKDAEGNETDKLAWDIHFWLGKTTSQDEAGTAAYKTVELDDFLGGAPVQHREVCGHESTTFCNYFKEKGGIQLLAGGVASGFNRIKPEEYRPRLLHLKGRKNVRIEEVELSYKSMISGDVFILDNGLNIYQWQGKGAGMKEKNRAAQLCRAIDDERSGKPEVVVFTQGDSDEAEFPWELIGGEKDTVPEISDAEGDDDAWEKDATKKLYRVSDADGELSFTLAGEGDVSRSLLDEKDAFVLDLGREVFVWVGSEVSPEEKSKAMQMAQDYLKRESRPAWLPLTKLYSGGDNEVFNSSFSD